MVGSFNVNALLQAPNLFFPSNGSNAVVINPIVKWNRVTGATSYQVQVSTVSNFTTTIQDDPVVTDTMDQIILLSQGTNYFWRVRAKNSLGYGNWSSVFTFTTVPTVPIAPKLVYPDSGVITQPLSLTLRWFRTATADSYSVRLSIDSLFNTSVLDTTLSDSFLVVNSLLNDTSYFWKVRAKNLGGNSLFSSIWKFSTGISIRTINFSLLKGWNMISVPLMESNYLTNSVFPSANSSAFAYSTGYKKADTLHDGKGYWLKFGFSQTHNVTGMPISQDTFFVVRGWNIIGSISSPVLTSSIHSVPSGIITTQFFGYNGTYFNADTINPGKGYWVKVNQAGQLIVSSSSLVSAHNKIVIIPTSEMPPSPPEGTESVETDIPKEYSLSQNYPNPFNPTTSIEFQNPTTGFISLKVYNLLGQEVATLLDAQKAPGTYRVTWDASGLASGVYFYKLIGNGFNATKKLMLVR